MQVRRSNNKITQKKNKLLHSGTEQYEVFLNESFVTKLKKLSDTIKKLNFPNLKNYAKSNLKPQKNSVRTNETAQTQKKKKNDIPNR